MNKQTFMVIGGSSDVGLATAHRFALEGYDIILTFREAPDQLSSDHEALINDLKVRYQVEVEARCFDALDYSGKTIVDLFHGLNLDRITVLYAIGVMPGDTATTNEAIAANYSAPVALFDYASEHLEGLRFGALIGISSVAGDRGRGSNYHYGSTKAAFSTYLDGLRNHLHNKAINVITVKPGFISTKMTDGLELPERLTATADEVADAIYSGVQKAAVQFMPKNLAANHVRNSTYPGHSLQEAIHMKPGLALFDFDGTITSKDTMLEFIAHLRGRKALWFGLLITSPVLLLGKSGLLPSKIAKEMFLKRSFKGLTKEQIKASAEVFTKEVLPTLLREDALEEITRHKSLGHDVAIVTASCSLWVEKWALEKYNITLIATQLNDNLEGGIKGDNNNGPKKVENIVSIYDLNTYDHIYAYGDSRGDVEMMKLAHTSYYRFFN